MASGHLKGQRDGTVENLKKMSYKTKAKAYHTAVSAYDVPTIREMVVENYIQHNPKVPTGREAFLALIPKLEQHGSKIENIRMIEDGRHIIMHHRWTNATPFGFQETAAFHIIRFDEDGLIAEHWNVMMGMSPPNASNRCLLGGTRAITDLGKTYYNKARITQLFSIFINEDCEAITRSIPDFFKEDFQKHSPAQEDGTEYLTQMVKEGSQFPNYTVLHAVFGEGNFVLAISEGILLGKNMALYDLFSLEDGQVAAHWSIYQDIPTTNLANANTMFKF